MTNSLQSGLRQGRDAATKLKRVRVHEVGVDGGLVFGLGSSVGVGRLMKDGKQKVSLVFGVRFLGGLFAGAKATARRLDFLPLEETRVPFAHGAILGSDKPVRGVLLPVGRHVDVGGHTNLSSRGQALEKIRGYHLGPYLGLGEVSGQFNIKLTAPFKFRTRAVRLADSGDRHVARAFAMIERGDLAGAGRALNKAERIKSKLDRAVE